MTTQRELIETFLDGENSPSVASNMNIFSVHGGSKAYLVGGYHDYGTPGIVYAVREPIKQLTVFNDARYTPSYGQLSCTGRATTDQFYLFNNILTNEYEDEYTITGESGDGFPDRVQPSTRYFDDLNDELHNE